MPEINPSRIEDATQLLNDFELQEDAEFFSDPSNRLDFLSTLEYDDFFSLAQHVNARVRGYEPRDKVTVGEKGGYLPSLGTPMAEDKPKAFEAGFNVISKYLKESRDSSEQKVKGVAMATEALIIWVHPFNDGNGRTSRFLAKFIEDGTTDTEKLIAETASSNERLREYGPDLRVDSNTTDPNNEDLMLDDDEREAIRKSQAELPVVEGIALSIDALLNDKSLQEKVEMRTDRNRSLLNASRERRALEAQNAA